ncbi:MAG TPA: galactoside ABC transporter substrate-binding protein, partial [Chloroflexi bacterium]|nr:galactoside ABC transporter substrate-binding protein [Chloroflexota bacterium]
MKSRNIFLTVLLVLVLAVFMVLSACSSNATPTAAPEKPTAEVPVAEEPAVEEPVYTIKDPVPFPGPNALELGGTEVNRQPISEIVAYRSYDEYHQAPWLDQFVADGTLPPVEERLPKEPQVYLTSGMSDGIGVYGDLWRGFSACPTSGYNIMAGVSMGWFGIESYTSRYGSLVKTGPLYRANQDIEPFPELAMSWDWSADGKELTMHLIEGAKWSDGYPFTADDVMFTWEGYVLDENVNSNLRIDALTWDGVATTLEKVDDYTIKFTFPVEKPMGVFYLLDDETFIVMPEHQLKPLHPKWSTTPTDYKAFENALAPDNLPIVTMGPWVITEYKTDELMIMRRNPYYWKVDEAGNQLPYMDEIQYVKGPSGAGRDLCTMAGDCDHMNLENPSTFVEAMTRAQEADATFEVTWGPETLGYALELNQSIDFGVQSEADTAVRQLLRTFEFRRALSHAMDRDGISQAIMRGPFLRPWAGGLYPGAPEFDKDSVVYYDYDPDSAKALLAQIGLKDTDGNGILNYTEGPSAGQDVVLAMTANEDQREAVNIAEALVNQFAAVGIKVNYRTVTSATRSEIVQQGTWDMHVSREGQVFALPFTRVVELAPITQTTPPWHREGDVARSLQPFEEKLNEIVLEYRDTYDFARRQELMFEYNQVFTENLYDIGIFVGRYGLGLAKRSMNVPPGTPVFMYTWVEDAILLDQIWT